MTLVRKRICAWCSEEFTCSRHSREYCSTSCRGKLRYAKDSKKNLMKCRVCKTPFKQLWQQHPFCSKECRHHYHIKTKSEKTRERADPLLVSQKERFFASGGFSPGTVFIPSPNREYHTLVFCPDCGQTGEGCNQNLANGFRPCSCGPARQKEAYINFVKECAGPIAVKFGIANRSEIRIRNQNSCCIYDVENFGVWEFETKKSCLAAERECKQTLECGVLTKEEMPDGYTETTWVYNLEKIITIYEKHGGKRIK